MNKKVVAWRHKVVATRAAAVRHAHMIGLRPDWGHRERHISSIRKLRHMVRTWSAKNTGWVAFWRTHYPRLMCIHVHEGAWNASDNPTASPLAMTIASCSGSSGMRS